MLTGEVERFYLPRRRLTALGRIERTKADAARFQTGFLLRPDAVKRGAALRALKRFQLRDGVGCETPSGDGHQLRELKHRFNIDAHCAITDSDEEHPAAVAEIEMQRQIIGQFGFAVWTVLEGDVHRTDLKIAPKHLAENGSRADEAVAPFDRRGRVEDCE
jgi:hypothetical protein